ncbi:PEP-CTERM protein-sorting domain-containing protein [Flavobacterium chungbukense]|uniref:Uncharacterized protein n=1 Tax=Flavobacterium chungbukense TaxID=877464 RepID=A0ABP7YA09_9FLAO
MKYVLIIFFLFVILIGVAYYYDYKKDKKYFKKSIKDIAFLMLIIVGIYIISELGDKVLECFYK